jgi:outer membrane protein assembly factor BamB
MPNGKICFGGQDGYLYILNPDSTLFHRENIGFISASPVIGSDGAIYIATEIGSLCRINSNGIIDWEFFTDGDYTSSPAVVNYSGISGDIIYFKVNLVNKRQSDVDSLYMIKSDGTRFAAASIFPVWGLPSEYIVSSPIVGNDGTIYIGGGPSDDDIPQGGLFALSGRGTVASSSWPLFRHDAKNTGRVQ